MHEPTPDGPPATTSPVTAAPSDDREQLQLLAIFHYVLAGLAFLFACIPVVHFGMGALMAAGAMGEQEPPMAAVGCLFMVISGAVILAGWAYAALLVVAGRNLAAHRRYTFCLVMAAVSCTFAPFGTVLGVLTLMVLVRPSVKALFAAAAAPGAG